jgi:hypothetical protein
LIDGVKVFTEKNMRKMLNIVENFMKDLMTTEKLMKKMEYKI